MAEQKPKTISNGWAFLLMFMIGFAFFIAGLALGSSGQRDAYNAFGVNETYQYALGYTNGHNEAIARLPVSSEPSVSQSDVANQIMEALGSADKVDLEVHGSQVTGKTTLSLNIEFTTPQTSSQPSANYSGTIH